MYVLVKAPLQVYMEMQHKGACLKTNTCICLETPPSAVFYTHKLRMCFNCYIVFQSCQIQPPQSSRLWSKMIQVAG